MGPDTGVSCSAEALIGSLAETGRKAEARDGGGGLDRVRWENPPGLGAVVWRMAGEGGESVNIRGGLEDCRCNGGGAAMLAAGRIGLELLRCRRGDSRRADICGGLDSWWFGLVPGRRKAETAARRCGLDPCFCGLASGWNRSGRGSLEDGGGGLMTGRKRELLAGYALGSVRQATTAW